MSKASVDDQTSPAQSRSGMSKASVAEWALLLSVQSSSRMSDDDHERIREAAKPFSDGPLNFGPGRYVFMARRAKEVREPDGRSETEDMSEELTKQVQGFLNQAKGGKGKSISTSTRTEVRISEQVSADLLRMQISTKKNQGPEVLISSAGAGASSRETPIEKHENIVEALLQLTDNDVPQAEGLAACLTQTSGATVNMWYIKELKGKNRQLMPVLGAGEVPPKFLIERQNKDFKVRLSCQHKLQGMKQFDTSTFEESTLWLEGGKMFTSLSFMIDGESLREGTPKVRITSPPVVRISGEVLPGEPE